MKAVRRSDGQMIEEPLDIRQRVNPAFASLPMRVEMTPEARAAWNAEKARIHIVAQAKAIKLSKIGRERMKGKAK